MKRNLLKTIIISLILAGCTIEDGSSEKEEYVEAEESKEYYFEDDGIAISVNDDSDKLVSLIEKAQSVYEMPLCGLEGREISYDFVHYELDIIETQEYSKVYSIVFKDDLVTTMEGIYIGEKEDKIVELYGEPDERETYSLIYTNNSTKLVFIVKDGYVSSIQYFSTILEL